MSEHETIYLTKELAEDEDSWLWCQDSVGDEDVKYIRADIVEQNNKSIRDEAIEEFAIKLENESCGGAVFEGLQYGAFILRTLKENNHE